MRDNKLSIPIIAVLIIAIISIGIAFATFSTTLNIGGHATVDATSWEIVFEGKTNPNVMDAPTPVGTAAQVTLPTIKNNATEISTYSVTLKTPGDSITYDFKIHNKGSYDATVSSLVIAGVSNPSSPISGSALVTDSAVAQANANTLSQIEYKFYYTDDNTLVGQNPTRDCLAAGETENVSLRIVFSSSSATDTSILPSTDLVLDNLGVTMVYTQGQNCTNNNQGGNGGGNSGGNEQVQHDFYLKEINNEPNVCLLYNSTEYCFDRTTNTASLSQVCTALGGTGEHRPGMGCNSGDAYVCYLGYDSNTGLYTYTIDYYETDNTGYDDPNLTNVLIDYYYGTQMPGYCEIDDMPVTGPIDGTIDTTASWWCNYE